MRGFLKHFSHDRALERGVRVGGLKREEAGGRGGGRGRREVRNFKTCQHYEKNEK